MKHIALLLFLLIIGKDLSAQLRECNYVMETRFQEDSPVVYRDNKGTIKLNPNTGDFSFSTDFSNLKTGDKKTDSLLAAQDQNVFLFQANVGKSFFSMINDENKETYQKVAGTITINKQVYNTDAYVKLDNFTDKSNFNNTLFDFKMEIDPSSVQIPVLSNYFTHLFLLEVDDGFINISQ